MGTNLIVVNLDYSINSAHTDVKSDNIIIERDNVKIVETKYVTNTTVIVVLVIVILLVIVCSVGIVLYVRRTARSAQSNNTLPDNQRSDLTDSDDHQLPQGYDQVKNITLGRKMVGTAV